MKRIFENTAGTKCVFTDEFLAFMSDLEDVFYPYGSLDTLRMNLLGDLEAIGGVSICCFEFEKEDRAEARKMVHFAKKSMKTAPKAEKLVVNLRKRKKHQWIPEGLSDEEQLACYKALFVKGFITGDEYNFRKKLLQP